jgi:hypothetical protein
MNGIYLPDGKKLLYSDYADNTTLFLSSLEDLHKCVSTFNIYSKYSGMKLNLSKSIVIPLGAALEHDPPRTFPFKYLPADEEESLLGVPVSRIHDPNLAWDLMISKLAESIKHWSAQRPLNIWSYSSCT